MPTKSSGLAAILAFLIPGLGHIYLGKITEGIIFMILAVAIWVLAGFAIVVSLLIFGILGFVIGLILYFIFWAWQIYDAYNKANEYNAAVQRTGRAPW